MAEFHPIIGAEDTKPLPVIRKISFEDIKQALKSGLDDFYAFPTHAIFLCLIYPLVGIIVGGLTLGYNVLPLLFPVAAGFALVGPFAALHLYELSRRREKGMPIDWGHAFDVARSASFPAIMAVGVLQMVLFFAWLFVARTIYQSLFGILAPDSIGAFLTQVFTTPEGWKLILIGNAVGFVFAAIAFAVTVVSLPMLLDRDVGAAVAVLTSFRAVAANPVTMAAWGIIVVALLVLGSIPAFVGLAVVVPILGHSTWHLYRKLIEK